ncbi:hypothetical protein HK102_012878, partial [Quaeritorhiza haematococci]
MIPSLSSRCARSASASGSSLLRGVRASAVTSARASSSILLQHASSRQITTNRNGNAASTTQGKTDKTTKGPTPPLPPGLFAQDYLSDSPTSNPSHTTTGTETPKDKQPKDAKQDTKQAEGDNQKSEGGFLKRLESRLHRQADQFREEEKNVLETQKKRTDFLSRLDRRLQEER